MLKSLRLAATLLWKEIRAGEWLVMLIALLLAITAVTSLHFYTDRLLRGLNQQSAALLGGNLVVSSSTPIPTAWITKAQSLRLRTAEMWTYPSMISAQDKLQLVNIQAVSAQYPLLGMANVQPAAHTVWVEPRLLPLLAIHLHDTVTIGIATFRTAKLLTTAMAPLANGWLIAPRILMRLDDVPATQTVLAGSRIDYRLLLVGNTKSLQQFRAWLTPTLTAGQQLLDASNQPSALRNTLQHTQNYLQLILLICLAMSGVAIALSAQQYIQRHYIYVALWRCLGASRQHIIHIFLWQLFIVASIGGLAGIIAGYGLQAAFSDLFQHYLQFPLPTASAMPFIVGLITSILLLFAFAYPVISDLPHTAPIYLWRSEKIGNPIRRTLYFITILSVTFIFVYWAMDFSLLTLFFISILLLSVGFLYVLSHLILTAIRYLLNYTEGTLRRGLRQLTQYPDSISLQLCGFCLILTLLITLGMVRSHLIENWRQTLPAQTPNYFAFNIAPIDVPALQKLLWQNKVFVEAIYPMVRGRIIALNGNPILTSVPVQARGHNALHRELNLSWMWQYPSDNKITLGRHWTLQDKAKPLVSVERNLADALQLKLGDTLTFQVGATTFSAVITNFRSLDWSSFHPNFFMIFPPGLIEQFPTTYITSFHLSNQQAMLINQLVQQFPNITVIDVASLLQQIQELIGKVTLAMQYLFLFALGAGILIFITCLQASMDERREMYHLLRVLGASRQYIIKSLVTEFTCLLFLIVCIALFLSSVIVYVLDRFII